MWFKRLVEKRYARAKFSFVRFYDSFLSFVFICVFKCGFFMLGFLCFDWIFEFGVVKVKSIIFGCVLVVVYDVVVRDVIFVFLSRGNEFFVWFVVFVVELVEFICIIYYIYDVWIDFVNVFVIFDVVLIRYVIVESFFRYFEIVRNVVV